MSYFEKTQILAADSPSIDAFARWRTSGLTTLFDSKQIYDSGSLLWSTKIIGNATASYDQNGATVLLVASESNSSVTRQTKRYFNYQPGKSQLIICTTNFVQPPGDGAIRRVGYFDDDNGIFFKTSGSQFGLGLRSKASGTPVTTFISQSDWNLDKMDGTGPSGKILNLTASQIFFFDVEWLGVGRIRYGVFQSGIPTYVHQITNANALPSNAPVYMSTPNLPLRYELVLSGSTPSSMHHICSAVASEGGIEKTGPVRSADFPRGGTLTINAGSQAALIAIRPKLARRSSTIIPRSISISNQAGNQNYKWAISLNPTTGSNFTWVDVPNSSVQYATGSTAMLITGEGTKLVSGYVSTTADNVEIPFDPAFGGLGIDINGVADTLVVWVYNFGTNTTFTAAIGWQESV